jgi:hypothetical protein
MKTFLRITFILIAILLFSFGFLWVLVDYIMPAVAEEELFVGDSDYQELQIDATDQLILDARLKYYWDEVYQGTSTIGHKVIMTATVK